VEALKVGAQKLVEPRFVKRGNPAGQGRDPCFVYIDAHNLVAQLSHGCGMDGTEIAAANNRNLHEDNPRGG
jgi:hypothetical protein